MNPDCNETYDPTIVKFDHDMSASSPPAMHTYIHRGSTGGLRVNLAVARYRQPSHFPRGCVFHGCPLARLKIGQGHFSNMFDQVWRLTWDISL